MALRLSVDISDPADRVVILGAEVIQAGGVVVYPTDTLYGMGANAWNDAAVNRVQAIKKRGEDKPVLVLVHTPGAALALTDEITEAGRALMESFWPGPLTLLFRCGTHVPSSVTRGSGRIGVRVPSNRLCIRLCELSGCPLISTSANITGEPVPGTLEEIERVLGPGVDLFIDGGVLPPTLPSTIVDVAGPVPRMVREGVIPFARIQHIVPTLTR
ncbi:MAG TPA: L-threonylcarbamoyladenylate synthase [Bacteroidota bacterium]|nr:L-threonylcarbamoyladenylate synthase [Bacteroidota bacterium]